MHKIVDVNEYGSIDTLCQLKMYVLLGVAIKSNEERPCNMPADQIPSAREIFKEELQNFFELIKNEGETFFISVNTQGWKETISIDGEYLGNPISFENCIKKPYSIISTTKYSLNLYGYDGYIKFSYCKWVD